MPIPIPQPDVFSISPILQAHQVGTQMRYQGEDRQRAEEDRLTQAISQMAYRADTPEEWATMISTLERRFGRELTEFRDFSSRSTALGMLPLGDQFAIQTWDQSQEDRRIAQERQDAIARGLITAADGQPVSPAPFRAGGTRSLPLPVGEGEIYPGQYEQPVVPFGNDWAGYLAERAPGLNVEGMDPSFGPRIAAAAAAFEAENPGQRAAFTSLARSAEQQAQLRANYTQQPVVWNGVTYRPNVGPGQQGLAAAPGQSRHQGGTAADVADGPFLAWMQQNASRFGLAPLAGRAGEIDPGHFQLAEGVATGGAPFTPQERALFDVRLAGGDYDGAFQMLQQALLPPEPRPLQEVNGQMVYADVPGDYRDPPEAPELGWDWLTGQQITELNAQGVALDPQRSYLRNLETGDVKTVGGEATGLAMDIDPATGAITLRQGPGAGRLPTGLGVSQEASARYSSRMAQADTIIGDVGTIGTSWWQRFLAAITPETFGEVLNSQEYQRYAQAERNFINAVLRRESGAVISASEFTNARMQYMPQPGNGPEVLEQKRQAREFATLLMGAGVTPGFNPYDAYRAYQELTGAPPPGVELPPNAPTPDAPPPPAAAVQPAPRPLAPLDTNWLRLMQREVERLQQLDPNNIPVEGWEGTIGDRKVIFTQGTWWWAE